MSGKKEVVEIQSDSEGEGDECNLELVEGSVIEELLGFMAYHYPLRREISASDCVFSQWKKYFPSGVVFMKEQGTGPNLIAIVRKDATGVWRKEITIEYPHERFIPLKT